MILPCRVGFQPTRRVTARFNRENAWVKDPPYEIQDRSLMRGGTLSLNLDFAGPIPATQINVSDL